MLRAQTDVDVVDVGFVTSDRLKAMVYSAADVYVHPARAEVLSYTVLESIACGTPVVAFRVGGVPDLVRDGVSGFLAPPEDTVALAAGLRRLLEDASLRATLGARCRALAEAEYRLDLQARCYVDLYEALLPERGAA